MGTRVLGLLLQRCERTVRVCLNNCLRCIGASWPRIV